MVNGFRLSPAGDHVAYGTTTTQWRIRDLGTGQEIDLGNLTATPVWSPDGSLIHRHITDNGSAVVDMAGNVRRLPFSAPGEVKWSSDGRYLAYLFDWILWVGALDGTPTRIAGDIVNFEWSPTAPILAYSTLGPAMPTTDATANGRKSYIYDIATSLTLLAAPAGGIMGWSPDGRKVMISRLDSVDPSSHARVVTLQAADAFERKLINIGTLDDGSFPIASPATDAWIYGPWQIRPDLSGVDTIAEGGEPVDWTPDGSQALILKGLWRDPERQLHYLDRRTGASRLLISQVGALLDEGNRGIDAVISPGGAWAALEMTDASYSQKSMVVDTQIGAQRSISSMTPGSFSPDERWLLGRTHTNSYVLYNPETVQ